MTNEERYKSTMERYMSRLEEQASSLESPTVTWRSSRSDKHNAQLSQGNPYYTQLMSVGSKQDEDALYELAIKWEAEQAGYQQERADKYADLQEQRAYDDPTAVVARQRRAGINPDVVGSSSGAGSSVGTGSSAVANMPSLDTPTDNTTPFASGSMLIQGLQAASSLIGSIASFGSAVVGSVNTLSMLPALREGANLANRLTNEEITSQELSNDSTRLGLITSGLDSINRLSTFITPETSEEDATSLMSALGISSDMIPNLYKGIQQWHNNPQYKAAYEQDKADAIAKEEFNKVFTRKVQHDSLALSADIELVEKSLKFSQTDLQSKVANLLNTDDNAAYLANKQEKVWDNEMQSAIIEGDTLDLRAKQVKRDLSSFKAQIDMVNKGIQESQQFIDEIFAEAKVTNVIPQGARLIDGVYLSAEEAAFVEIERQKILAYEALGSRFLSDANAFMIDTYMRHYFTQQLMQPNGYIKNLYNKTHPDVTSFMERMFTFDQISSGKVTSDDVVSSYSGIILDLLRFIK